jgi:serine/threonine protein kinase
MHRDVKPHNVMIDHENRKVGFFPVRLSAYAKLISCVSSIGVLLSSIIKGPSTTYEYVYLQPSFLTWTDTLSENILAV